VGIGAPHRPATGERDHRAFKSSRAALGAGADVRDLLGLWKVPPHARRMPLMKLES
jgi:hypothetical protein